jgi:hypothetical protein
LTSPSQICKAPIFRYPPEANSNPEVCSMSSLGTEGFVVLLSSCGICIGSRLTRTLQKLQRAIAESRGQTSDRPLPLAVGRGTSAEVSYRSGDESATETKPKQSETSTTGANTTTTTTKRKYRRHPRVSLTSSIASYWHVDIPSSLMSMHQSAHLLPM